MTDTPESEERKVVQQIGSLELKPLCGRKVTVKDHAGCYERTGVLMKNPLTDEYIVVVCARTPWNFEGSLFYLPLSLDKIVDFKISPDGRHVNLDTNIGYATGVFGEEYKEHMGKIKKALDAAK